MDQPVDIKFKVSLQNLCLLKVGQLLWQRNETKQKIVYFFKNSRFVDYQNFLPEITYERSWANLIKHVLAPIKTLSCPENLKRLIQHATYYLGLKIFNWIKYVTRKLKFDITYALDIHLTPDGKIDKKHIFQKWRQDETIEIWKLFNVACFFCFENDVHFLWHEMTHEMKHSEFYENKIYKNMQFHLIAYWTSILKDVEFIGFHRPNVLMEKLLDNSRLLEVNFPITFLVHIYSGTLSIEENMFRCAVYEGMDLAVDYFWAKLTDTQRTNNLNFVIRRADNMFVEWDYNEISLFFMSNMTLRENMDFCLKPRKSNKMNLLLYPQCEELFMMIFDILLQNCMQNPGYQGQHLKLLEWIDSIFTLMRYDFIAMGSYEAGRCQRIFHQIWNKLSGDAKDWLVELEDWSLPFKLLEIEDFDSLRLIVNDPYFRRGLFTKRSIIILCMKALFKKFSDERKLYLEDRFAKEIGLDDEERIKLRIDFFNKEYNFYYADV